MSLQGCSEQRVMEVLRRTGPLVRLQLLRRVFRLRKKMPPVPPLHPLRHSYSFSESSSFYGMDLKKIQETGALIKEQHFHLRFGFKWWRKTCFELKSELFHVLF